MAYIPARGRVVGLSKLARLVQALSRRVTSPENVCTGVLAVVEKQLCPEVGLGGRGTVGAAGGGESLHYHGRSCPGVGDGGAF